MLILGTTTDKIQVTLSNVVTTNQLDCIATYKDITTSAYSGSAPILVTTNNTTSVDLVPAPASNTQRIVDFISIYNNDTANATVTVTINRNDSIGVLFKCTLKTSESLVYSEGAGWNIHSNDGSPKQSLTYDTNAIADDAVTTAKIADANVTPAKLSQPLTLAATVASTSGTSIDFTGIPSWVKRITIMFDRVSTNTASSTILIQIGSGSISNTGYVSQGWTATTGLGVVTDGFSIGGVGSPATNILSGMTVLSLVGGDLWVSSSTLGFMNVTSTGWVSTGSSSALSGALDRVRITTTSGTAVFDAGKINILYE
jgi:hypothetical protein